MDKLQKVRDIATRKRIKGKIVMSTRKDKKYMILINGKRIHFGAKNYSDFLDHKDKKEGKDLLPDLKIINHIMIKQVVFIILENYFGMIEYLINTFDVSEIFHVYIYYLS